MQIDDNTDTNSIGFRLMLDRGIMPTEETLDIACKYLYNQDIHLIIERKILPTEINFQNYISHNPYISNSRPYVQQYAYEIPIVDNINVDMMIQVFMGFGLQFTGALVEKSIKRNLHINFFKYEVEYTMDIYDLFIKHNHYINDEHMNQFMSIPKIKHILEFKEAVKRRTWTSIKKIGLKYKIIPDQKCIGLACNNCYENVPINLLKCAKIISLDYGDEYDEYIKFVSDQKLSLILTSDDVHNLQQRQRLKCLGHISKEFAKNMQPTT